MKREEHYETSKGHDKLFPLQEQNNPWNKTLALRVSIEKRISLAYLAGSSSKEPWAYYHFYDFTEMQIASIRKCRGEILFGLIADKFPPDILDLIGHLHFEAFDEAIEYLRSLPEWKYVDFYYNHIEGLKDRKEAIARINNWFDNMGYYGFGNNLQREATVEHMIITNDLKLLGLYRNAFSLEEFRKSNSPILVDVVNRIWDSGTGSVAEFKETAEFYSDPETGNNYSTSTWDWQFYFQYKPTD